MKTLWITLISIGITALWLIGLDIYVNGKNGVASTISWETLTWARANPIVACVSGLVMVGLSRHLFTVRCLPILHKDQPMLAWLLGGLAGYILVGLYWTQRGPGG